MMYGALAYIHRALVAMEIAVMLLYLDTPLSENFGVLIREAALDLVTVLSFDGLDALRRAILGVNNLSLLTANTALNDGIICLANQGLENLDLIRVNLKVVGICRNGSAKYSKSL
jgi:hypothetical protein